AGWRNGGPAAGGEAERRRESSDRRAIRGQQHSDTIAAEGGKRKRPHRRRPAEAGDCTSRGSRGRLRSPSPNGRALRDWRSKSSWSVLFRPCTRSCASREHADVPERRTKGVRVIAAAAIIRARIFARLVGCCPVTL